MGMRYRLPNSLPIRITSLDPCQDGSCYTPLLDPQRLELLQYIPIHHCSIPILLLLPLLAAFSHLSRQLPSLLQPFCRLVYHPLTYP